MDNGLQIAFQLIGGAIILYITGEILVKGASSLALRLGISEFIIGLTIVAIGTSSPEFFVSIIAAFKGQPAIALGNVIGSNIVNIGIALAFAAIVFPLAAQSSIFKRELPFLVLASLVLLVMCYDGFISRVDGIVLLLLLVMFMWFCINQCRNGDNCQTTNVKSATKSIFIDILLTVGGFIGLSFGSDFFVDGASALAKLMGVSEFTIGLTVVAIGTSLPEIVTSVIASVQKKNEIAMGTIVGSNIFNILIAIGVAGTVSPFALHIEGQMIDLTVMTAFAIILFPLLYSGRKLVRWEGIFLFLGYFGYLFYIIHRG